MSFRTKYTEYGLLDENLLGWYEFASVSDSGPLNNDLIPSGGSAVFGPPAATISNDSFILPYGDQKKFSAFFAIKKTSNSGTTILLSNYVSKGFLFGYTANYDFFICAKDGNKVFLKFFKDIKAAVYSIFILSRDGNNFTLSLYSPIAEFFESESLAIDYKMQLEGEDLMLGIGPTPNIFGFSSNFDIYELAVINASVPNFVKIALCEELYISCAFAKEDFRFSFTATKDKDSSYTFEKHSFNPAADTAIVLPYSPVESGFALNGITLKDSPVFYRNGTEESPSSLFDKYVRFTDQSVSDRILLDNFSNDVVLSSATGFLGYINEKVTPNKPIIYSGSVRQEDNFVTLDSGNLSHGKNITFKEMPNLINI